MAQNRRGVSKPPSRECAVESEIAFAFDTFVGEHCEDVLLWVPLNAVHRRFSIEYVEQLF